MSTALNDTAKKQPRLFLIAGLPASGRETAAETLLQELRAEGREVLYLAPEESSSAREDSSAVIELVDRAREGLLEGKDVILVPDEVTSDSRGSMLYRITERLSCKKICLLHAVPFERCLERCASGSPREERLRKAYLKWETPYYFEGWDEIRILYEEGSRGLFGTPEAYVERHMDFAQENVYHQETLGTHLRGVHDGLVRRGEPLLAEAGLIHDCGKPYTKSFIDYEGHVFGEAHYEHHENVGAYNALFFRYDGLSDEEILRISFLVGRHMDPHHWESEEAQEACRKEIGEELYRDLMVFHEADNEAKVTDLELGKFR